MHVEGSLGTRRHNQVLVAWQVDDVIVRRILCTPLICVNTAREGFYWEVRSGIAWLAAYAEVTHHIILDPTHRMLF